MSEPSGRPPGGTPLFDAWNRVLDYAAACGALATTGTYQRDIDSGRSVERSHGLAQAYGLTGEDITNIAEYGFALFIDQVAHNVHPVNAFASVAASLLLTGAEVTRDPRDGIPEPPVEPEVHKRDVLVRMLLDPHHKPTADSILNELHQNGWKIVPK